MKFLGQRDEYTCGARAILNAGKFFGLTLTARDLPRLKRLCRTGPPPHGTWPTHMEKGLRHILSARVKIGRRRPKNVHEFLRDVKSSDAAIVLFGRGRNNLVKEGHYLLVIPRNEQALTVNPWPKTRTTISMSWKTFVTRCGRQMGWLSNGRLRLRYPQVWVMNRRVTVGRRSHP